MLAKRGCFSTALPKLSLGMLYKGATNIEVGLYQWAPPKGCARYKIFMGRVWARLLRNTQVLRQLGAKNPPWALSGETHVK